MNNTKMLQFIKRWRDIENRQKEIDIEKSRWCRDLRAEFAAGSVGDAACLKWLETELGILPGKGEEYLARAAAARIVPDVETWDIVGGFEKIRPLVALALPHKDQVAVIAAAKVECKAIRTVMKDRGLGPSYATPPPRPDYRADAEQLAAYVADLPKVPKYISEILRRYPAPIAKAG